MLFEEEDPFVMVLFPRKGMATLQSLVVCLPRNRREKKKKNQRNCPFPHTPAPTLGTLVSYFRKPVGKGKSKEGASVFIISGEISFHIDLFSIVSAVPRTGITRIVPPGVH